MRKKFKEGRMEEVNIKSLAKNRKRYLLFPKDKTIQTITVWYYPCGKKKPFEFGRWGYLWIGNEWIMRNKRESEKYYKHFTLQKCPVVKLVNQKR